MGVPATHEEDANRGGLAAISRDHSFRRSSVRYTHTEIVGVTLVDIEPHNDERGFFARTFCADEFAEHGLESAVSQVNFAYNHAACRHTPKPSSSVAPAVPSSPSPSTFDLNPKLSAST